MAITSSDVSAKKFSPSTGDQVDTTIESASMDKSGKYRLTVDGGAVWVQIDGVGTVREPRAGQKINIKAAAMGSYFAKIEGQRAFRVRRER